jgi:hypothetical protein
MLTPVFAIAGGGGGPTTHKVKIHERNRGQCFLGPNYQLRLVFTYDSVLLSDRTYSHGEKFDVIVSTQEFTGDRKFNMTAYLIDKKKGVIDQDSHSEVIRWFKGHRFTNNIFLGDANNPPYASFWLYQTEEIYGNWLITFDGQQITKW